MTDKQTWGEIDTYRTAKIGLWNWNHQWADIPPGCAFSRCVRCDVVNNVVSKDTRCKGDTMEQNEAHVELFG